LYVVFVFLQTGMLHTVAIMESSFSVSFHSKIKGHIRSLHSEARRTEYVYTVLKNQLPPTSYVAHLRSLATVYSVVERLIFENGFPPLMPFFTNYSPKLPLLMADLEALHSEQVPTILLAESLSKNMADEVIEHCSREPYALLGYIYTLDGSLNGGSIFKEHLIKIMALKSGNGIQYFSSYGYNYRDFWIDFMQKMEELLPQESHQTVMEGAANAFRQLIDIIDALYPFDPDQLGKPAVLPPL